MHAHLFGLSNALSLIHGLIHDWVTFSLVVLVGLIQTALTIHSGKMSVPTTTLKVVQRRRIRVFWIFGAILAVLIILVGILNDKNQYQADKRAGKIQQQSAELALKFSKFIEKYPNGAPAPNNSQTNANQVSAYNRELNELLTIAHSLSSMPHQLTPNNPAVSPRSVPVQHSSIPMLYPSSLSNEEIAKQLENLGQQVRNIPTEDNSRRNGILGHGMSTPCSTPILSNNCQSEIQEVNDNEVQRYIEYRPQLYSVRSQALMRIQAESGKKPADSFDALDQLAGKRFDAPKTLNEAIRRRVAHS
jgi:hypothetical protein